MNMRAIREEKNMSQQRLAELTGLSRFSIIEYENCRVSPTIEKATLIATALGVSLDELIGNVVNPTSTPPEESAAGENRKAS